MAAPRGDTEYEYELNLHPLVCLVLGVISCLFYVFGSNDKKLWKRNVNNHMGKWDFLLILWLLVKSCIFYAFSSVFTAVVSICTVAALRDREITTFFEVHGLTCILAAQFLLYNVLVISVILRMYKK